MDRILAARRFRRLELAELRRLRVALRRASSFLVAAGRNPALRVLDREDLASRLRSPPRQLALFEAAAREAAATARTGEL